MEWRYSMKNAMRTKAMRKKANRRKVMKRKMVSEKAMRKEVRMEMARTMTRRRGEYVTSTSVVVY